MNSRDRIIAFAVGFVTLCLLLPFANSNAQWFGPSLKYATRNAPKHIVIEDFDNDSRKDIAVTDNSGGGVDILYQQSNGSFVSEVQFDVGSNLSGISAADFDEDGDIDLAITDQSLNMIYIYLNNITSFYPGQSISCSGQPCDILALEFTQDGNIDLIVVNIAGDNIHLYRGLGDGSFNTTFESLTAPSPSKIIVFDPYYNRLAVPSYDGSTVSVFYYHPVGHHLTLDSTYSAGGSCVEGIGGNFFEDYDNRYDLALSCRSDSTIKMLDNSSGHPHLSFSIEWPNFIPLAMAMADFDRDYDHDLASINNKQVGKLWLGDHDGTNFLGSLIDSIGSYPRDLLAEDMNNDTYTDLVVSLTGDDNIAIFYNQMGSPPGCDYTPGDVNNNGSVNGVDIVFAVSYLKGGPNHPPIDCHTVCPEVSNPFYAAGDVNGNCAFNGIDITYFVRFLKLQVPNLLYCADCPPAG